MLEYAGQVHAPSRIVRTIFAAVIFLVSLAMIAVKYVVLPLKNGTPPDLPVGESLFHLAVIVMAVLVYDKDTGAAIFDKLLTAVPFLKGGK